MHKTRFRTLILNQRPLVKESGFDVGHQQSDDGGMEMQTYFTSAQDLWQTIQEAGGSMSKDFELSHYGEEDGVGGYVLLYKGMTHDIYRVNRIVEMYYNKLVSSGLENNVQLIYRTMNRPEKYRESKQEAVIEIYPGLHIVDDNDHEEVE